MSEAKKKQSQNGQGGHSSALGPPKIQYTITFRDLTYEVDLEDKAQGKLAATCKGKAVVGQKKLLDNITGTILPSQFLAVMGPSGAGKSTFLNLLAGRLDSGMSGTLNVNGRSLTSAQRVRSSALVAQDDLLFAMLTVKETLHFSAILRLPNHLSRKEKIERADNLMKELGIDKAANTRIGRAGSAGEGVSGGERKRVAIACELLTDPGLLFVDEPTSGLDSFTAESVVRSLRRLARTGRTVVVTIHQPSSEIYQVFDKLMLLARGKLAYFGESKDAVEYFRDLGFPCPKYTNPSDFFLTLLAEPERRRMALEGFDPKSSGESSASATDKYSDADEETGPVLGSDDLARLLDATSKAPTIAELRAAQPGLERETQKIATADFRHAYNSNFFVQFAQIYIRSTRTFLREPIMLRSRLFQTVILAIIAGIIFLQLPPDQIGLANRAGVLYFIAINQTVSSLFGTTLVFPAELPLFKREHGNSMYSSSAYFWAKTMSEVPFWSGFPLLFSLICYFMIGLQDDVGKFFIFACALILMSNAGNSYGYIISVAAPTADAALAVGPIILIPLFLFGGYFTNVASFPGWLIWVQWLSPVRYGFQALAVNEYLGLTAYCEPSELVAGICPMTRGEDYLTKLNFTLEQFPIYFPFVLLIAVMIFFRILAWLILVYKNYRPQNV